MHPTLLSIGSLQFHAYTFMMAVAFLTAVLLSVRENYKLEQPYPVTPAGGLWVYFGALVGARLYWILQYDVPAHFYRALFFWQGGLVFYGGLAGGVIGAIAYLKCKGVPIVPMGDIVMPYLALGHAIGRVGCFLNGCCWGEPTSQPWGVCFPKTNWGAYEQQLKAGLIDRQASTTLPVHPTQLYCAFGLVCIFFVLRYVYKHHNHTGLVLTLYPLLYGLLRFVVECFRGDSTRPLLGMTVSQLIALGLVFGAGACLALLYAFHWRCPATAKTMEEPGEGPTCNEQDSGGQKP